MLFVPQRHTSQAPSKTKTKTKTKTDAKTMTSLYLSLFRPLLRLVQRLLPVAAFAALALPAVSHAQNVGHIRNSASSQCMDVLGNSMQLEAAVGQFGCVNQGNQQWRLFPLSANSNFYKLQVIHSWQCLDVFKGSTAPGAPLIQWTCTDAENQQFELRPQHDGFALVGRQSGLCVQMEGWPWATGNRLVQQACDGSTAQTWQLPVTTVLQSANSGMCMDVDEVSKLWWAPVNQWPCNGQTNQQWEMTQTDGWYTLKSVNSGLCLDVPNATWDSGAGLIQYACQPGAWNEQFKIRAQGGGFFLMARHSGQVRGGGRWRQGPARAVDPRRLRRALVLADLEHRHPGRGPGRGGHLPVTGLHPSWA